jgi:tryptophanyl-tRNA synthetase
MIFQKYGSGKMLTGELKQELIKVLQNLVGAHRKREIINHLLYIKLYLQTV